MEVTCGIYLYDINSGKFLIGHAARTKVNNWSIPKGLPDEGEDYFTAACRELYEETSIKTDEINILHKEELAPVKYKKRNKTLYPFLLVTDTDLSGSKLCCHSLVNNDYPEIDKFKWVTAEEMRGLVHESQVPNIDRIESSIKKHT